MKQTEVEVLPDGRASNTENAFAEYLTGYNYSEYLSELNRSHNYLYRLIDERNKRAENVSDYIAEMNRKSWEFEGRDSGGRGNEYNCAQQHVKNRCIGMTRLLELFGPNHNQMPNSDTVVLDALGGDGTLRRFAETQLVKRPQIVCADISKLMIDACRDQRYPYIRQSATKSLLGNDKLDGVLIAYGSHHLNKVDRVSAAAEGYRTLKLGGRFVLHDFEANGRVSQWFSKVVHRYSDTGHPHPHFTEKELRDLLSTTGFRKIEILRIDDSFLTESESENDARLSMLLHLYYMYGLTEIPMKSSVDYRRFESLVEITLGPITVIKRGKQFVATLYREALVALGVK
ncbi:MAG: class I SAM-dependent methyltransferase [Gammaproteobacteria bacterium]|nr:class I SAM-dependent methyltransferase [Gammaproteobacteria bacterium]